MGNIPNEQCSFRYHNLQMTKAFFQKSILVEQLQNCTHHSFLSIDDLHSTCNYKEQLQTEFDTFKGKDKHT